MYTYGDCPRSFGMRSTLAVRMLGGARASSSVAAGDARQLLAPHGVLRAAINFANPLLVSGRGPKGIEGVAPSMAAALADRLSVPLELVVFPNPGSLGDAAPTGEWDVGLIGAEPQRAKLISFSTPYVEVFDFSTQTPISPICRTPLFPISQNSILLGSSKQPTWSLGTLPCTSVRRWTV